MRNSPKVFLWALSLVFFLPESTAINMQKVELKRKTLGIANW